MPSHWSHARLFASESRVTKIFKIIKRVGFTFKKFLKLKFYRGIIFHGSSRKNRQKPRRAAGLGTHPFNICVFEVYKGTWADHRQVRRLHNKCGLTMILYDVPSDIARNILDITFHT